MSRTTMLRIRGDAIPSPPVTAPMPGPAGPSAVGFHTAASDATRSFTPAATGPTTPPDLTSMQPCGSSPTVHGLEAVAMPTGWGLQVVIQPPTSEPPQFAGPFRQTSCDQPVE